MKVAARIAVTAFCAALLAPPLAVSAADPSKVVRYAFRVAENNFDAAQISDRYSFLVIGAVFDSLLTYDYLARPVKLVPNVLEAMPEVTDSGATYTLRLRKGVYFAPDAAFKGKKRELVAQDYAYSIRRLYDPKLHSPNLFFFEGKVIGADEVRARAVKGAKYDYDAPIPGLEVLDRYTLRIRLRDPDYNFLYVLALPVAVGIAREVVEFYGDDITLHPVGSGAFYVKEWQHTSHIVLEANPNFREEYFHATGDGGEADNALIARLNGKRLPIVGRIECTVIEEAQPRWLGFLNKEFDYLEYLPNEFINTVAPSGRLAPNLAKLGVHMQQIPEMEITITAFFNMEDPVIGGYTAAKVALRRAMSLGYNQPEEIAVVRKGQALSAQGLVPPGAAGYDPDFRSNAGEYDPAKAKALLDTFGYVDHDGDGYRELPDGKPLVVEIGSAVSSEYNDLDVVWKKSMDAIGINVKFKKGRWPDLSKEARKKTLQAGSFIAWFADYPDGDNFLQLLYGPNMAPQSNFANFNLPAYNRLYQRARLLPDSAERNNLYREMTRLFIAYAPWKLGVNRVQTHLSQPWLLNYRKHPFLFEGWKYLDVDLDAQRKAMR